MTLVRRVRLAFTIVTLALGLSLASVALAQDAHGIGPPAPPAALTELQKLKAERFQLRVQLATCQATVQDREERLLSAQLSAEQAALVEEFRATLKAAKEDVFDWATLTFSKPPVPATPIAKDGTR